MRPILVLPLLVALACEGGPTSAAPEEARDAGGVPSAQAADAERGPGAGDAEHGSAPGAAASDEATAADPAPSTPAAAPARTFSETITTAVGLAVPVPTGWVAESPASSMRLAQLRVPGVDGAADGEVVLFYFGPGQGGGVEENLDRWRGQLQQTEAQVAATRIDRRASPVGPLTILDASGRYVAETRPGSGQRVDLPGQRMLAAVVETERGAIFFKGVGPEATMEAALPAFDAMLDALSF